MGAEAQRHRGGVGGTAGSRSNYFSDGPDFVLTQSDNRNPRFKAIGRYSASTGHGATLFFPDDPAHWNGKLFMTAHGAGPYAGIGALLPRDPNADFNSLTNVNRYVGLMLDRGYAVAHTLRSAHLQGGDIVLTLEDGTTLEKQAWTRLRLLKPGERFSQRAYVACVAKAAATPVAEGLLPPGLLAYYVKRAVASRVAEDER